VGLTVKRSVSIYAIVTDQLKEELRAELQEAIDATQRRMDQLDFQGRRFLSDLQSPDLTQAMAARRQIEAEKRRHEALKQDLVEQLAEVDKLEMGSEFARGTLEGNTEVNVGDDLMKTLAGAAIVIKDGLIVEIREG
jgi:predicted RNase H-like nuclease (RuvC/YqgF family)